METAFGPPNQTAAKVAQVERFLTVRGIEFVDGPKKGLLWEGDDSPAGA